MSASITATTNSFHFTTPANLVDGSGIATYEDIYMDLGTVLMRINKTIKIYVIIIYYKEI